MNRAKRSPEAGEETDTQVKLLEAAIDLFSTRGFSGTSIRDIARAMDMSISNIYHYYGSKDGILVALLERSSQALLSSLHGVAGRAELEPLERFRLLVRTHVRLAGGLKRENRIYMIERDQLSEEACRITTRIQREVLGIYVRELELLRDAGLVRGRSVTVTALSALGVINWLLRWYRDDGELGLDEVVAEVEAFLLYGVLGGRCSPAPD